MIMKIVRKLENLTVLCIEITSNCADIVLSCVLKILLVLRASILITKMKKILWSSWNRTIASSSKTTTPCSRFRLLSTSCCNQKDKGRSQSTVDEAEIQMFSTMKDWWNLQGPMKALHSMNTLRIPFVRDGLVYCADEAKSLKPLTGRKILDVGCGGGILSEGLARLGAQVTGIDATKEMIEIAKEHSHVDPKIADNKPEYILTTIEEHAPKYKDYYDGIVASEVIEHVNNKEIFVKSCIEALKPEGRIFFTTPNRTRISQVASIWVAEYVLRLLPRGTHQYEKFITPNELTFLLERNGCHVEAVYGTFYHFLTNTWEFVKFQHFMYALQAVKLHNSSQKN